MLAFLKGFSAKTAVVAALILSAAAEESTAQTYRHDNNKKWVSIWGSMPQLTEPHNLPPEPFVSGSSIACPFLCSIQGEGAPSVSVLID